jgi:hypothetical protein
MKKLLIGILLAISLLGISVIPTYAATTATITVTAATAFIGISITQNTWTINGIDGSGKIAPDTIYYSNATGANGDVTAPTATVVDGDCYFVIHNTSTIVTNLVANMADFTSGDASTNINTGYATNGANAYGASTYTTGAAWPAGAVILKSSGSSNLKSSVAATTDVYFGIAIKTQSGAWTSGTSMTSTVTVVASS